MMYFRMMAVLGALGAGALVPLAARGGEWIDPCNGYQAYVAAGGGDSAPALALKRVCAITGARQISQPCLVYYTRQSATWPRYSEADLAADAAACEASMPGELADQAGPGEECGEGMLECPPAPEPDTGLECGEDGLECAPVPDPKPLEDQSDAGGLGGANVLPDAPASSAPADDPDGRLAYDAAERIMNAAYAQEVDQWQAAARRAIPLYQQAADKGYAPAWIGLGDLHEMGLGMPEDTEAALAAFHRAGAQGMGEGYERALYLLDQLERDAGFVDDFLALYRLDPGMALAVLDGVSPARSRAIQAHLQRAGYYSAALDGAFGPASRRALAAYAGGAPRPAPPPPAPATPPLTPLQVLSADIQRELTRVGCYHGEIDGNWGPQTVQAMDNFNYWAGGDGDTERPTEHALRQVSASLGPICGLD